MTAPVLIPPATTQDALDAAVRRVKAAAPEFAHLSLDERIAMLRRMRDGMMEVAEESVRLACAYKGHDFNSPHAGEEWLAGPMVTLRVLRLTEAALQDIKDFGARRLTAGRAARPRRWPPRGEGHADRRVRLGAAGQARGRGLPAKPASPAPT